ncbi:MAG: Smr/MutS family protein [Pseudomonadota bacterium]
MSRKRRPKTGAGIGDWELWERVAETVQPMDRTISPLARSRQKSLASTAPSGTAKEGSAASTEQANRAAMEAYLGVRRTVSTPVEPAQPSKSVAAVGNAASTPKRQPPKAPFLPSWQPRAQTGKRGAEPIDRKTKRKLSKGSMTIDARIDLHGMTQDQAHDALVGFIGMSHARGHRMVLVITGKGLSKKGEGVLRRMVPRWLVTPPLSHSVNGHDVSAQHHGGEGALYVRLRRQSASNAP